MKHKLSENQQRILRQLHEGWVLCSSRFGPFIKEAGMTRRSVNVHVSSFNGLVHRGVIVKREVRGGTTIWKLADQVDV